MSDNVVNASLKFVIVFILIFSVPKDNWRCDQYRWVNQGVRRLPKKDPLIKKTYFQADTPEEAISTL